jgi:hypothetical protein
MQTFKAVIAFLPPSTDLEGSDFISSGVGKHLRTFRNSIEVRTALHQAAISTDQFENSIDALDDGIPLTVPVSEEQFTNFYRLAKDESELEEAAS